MWVLHPPLQPCLTRAQVRLAGAPPAGPWTWTLRPGVESRNQDLGMADADAIAPAEAG